MTAAALRRTTTQERIERTITATLLCELTEEQKALLRCTILAALKEQDRDTRHACAEAVLACAHPHLPDEAQRAAQACMNAHAV